MKKITLFMTLLMWSFLFYGQTYLTEGFEGATIPPVGWSDVAGSTDVGGYLWASSTVAANNSGITGNSGSKSIFFNELFNLGGGSEDPNSPVTKDRWLVTPVINLSGATTPELTYYENVRFKDFPADLNGVYYSTDYAGDATTATWTPLNTTFGVDADEVWKIRGPFALPTNATVYIGFNYRDAPPVSSEWFIDDILVREQPTCVEPSAGTISSITSTSASFSWTSGPGGTETLWDVELVDITGGQTKGTGTVTTGVTNPHPFTSLASSNNYEAYVRADCGAGGKSEWSGPYAFATAGSNDDCVGAISVTHESNIALPGSATATAGTVNGATGGTVKTCANGTPNNDVWYSFVATSASATVRVESASTDFDPVLEILDGCGGSQIECIDGGTETQGEEVVVNSLTPGNTYYVRIYDWYVTLPTDGAFDLKVYRTVPLEVEDLEVNEFTFYPNPVKEKLNLRAQNNIENISVYNMLGQEILRTSPNSTSSEVDMSTLRTGAYFVKVTINGITETKRIIKR